MLTSGLVFCAMASLLVGYMTTAMRPPRASPSRKIHGASRDHYASAEALRLGTDGVVDRDLRSDLAVWIGGALDLDVGLPRFQIRHLRGVQGAPARDRS